MPDISRRTLLRSVSVAGAASVGAAAGIGTHALLSDEAVFTSNSLTSGSLDLEVATRTDFDGETSTTPSQDGPFPSTFVEESTVSVGFPNVEPTGKPASGDVTVAMRACDNPGRVWLRAHGEDSALADAIEVSVTLARTCGDAGQTVFDGSLSGFFDAYGDGVQVSARGPELGKVELHEDTFNVESDSGSGDTLDVDDVPGTLTLQGPNGPIEVEITGLHWKDEDTESPEVTGVDLGSDDVEFFRVDVKGGANNGGTETYRPGCTATVTDLLAPDNDGGEPAGLSHFVVYACADEPCIGCDPACLAFDWTLRNPKQHAGESLAFDLELHATQCRNTEAANPWQ